MEPIHIDCLLSAVLAVQNLTVEHTWELREELAKARINEPGFVLEERKDNVKFIGNALKKAGYNRGGVSYIVAPRVIALMEAIQSGSLDGLPQLVEERSKDEALELMQTVKGIGPKSAAMAWELLAV